MIATSKQGLIMSRGPGYVQKWLFGSLRHSPKPMTFAEIKAAAYPAESYESDMAKALGDSNVGRTRSLRRALRKLCDDGIVLAIGSGGRHDPHRYFIDPRMIAMFGEKADFEIAVAALEADPGGAAAMSHLGAAFRKADPS